MSLGQYCITWNLHKEKEETFTVEYVLKGNISWNEKFLEYRIVKVEVKQKKSLTMKRTEFDHQKEIVKLMLIFTY